MHKWYLKERKKEYAGLLIRIFFEHIVLVSFQACKLLSDDYEQVRSAAVQMVWVLSQLYPER